MQHNTTGCRKAPQRIIDNVMKEYTEKQLQHLYAKWLYLYGGSQDIKTFREYVKEYKDDANKYGDCPCFICQTEDY